MVNSEAKASVITVTQADCPLSCPMPTQPLWNAHPRVYLVLDANGKATCPYCETQYLVIDFERKDGKYGQ